MERGFYASSVDAWLSGKRQPVKRVNGEILAKFRRSMHNVSFLFFFGAIRTFLGLALLEKVCFKEDLVGDIFGKLFKEGTSDRDG